MRDWACSCLCGKHITPAAAFLNVMHVMTCIVSVQIKIQRLGMRRGKCAYKTVFGCCPLSLTLNFSLESINFGLFSVNDCWQYTGLHEQLHAVVLYPGGALAD
jgi:hypothetical protein